MKIFHEMWIDNMVFDKKAYNKRYREKNIQRDKVRHKKYYRKNRETLIKKAKIRFHLWYQKNKKRAKESHKKYYESHKEEQRVYTKNYYIKNKKRILKRCKKWYLKNKKKMEKYKKIWRLKNHERILKTGNAHRQQVKKECFFHYSPDMKCQHCGYSDIRTLSIDHIDGKGAFHRRKDKNCRNIYVWLKEREYPSGFQVLCMNCQWIKRVENNEITHRQHNPTSK